MTEELERPPIAPIVAVVAAGVVGLIVLRWLLGAILNGIRLALLAAVIAVVIYGVSRLRATDD